MRGGAARAVEIVGGGLAGLALGVGLRRAGVPVTILEAGDYPRHRVCGEFITGLPETVVERLGITHVFGDALHHDAVRWHAHGRALCEMRLPAPAIGLSRHALDARLAEVFVRAGGGLFTRRRAEGGAKEGRVWAAGRRRTPRSPWVGLKAHVRGLALEANLEFHLGAGAYVGLSAVEGGWVNVCGLFRRRAGLAGDTTAALARTLSGSGLETLAERVARAELRPGSACAVAGFGFDQETRAGDDLALGDACAMVPPFTGNGMAMAFTSAAIALGPLEQWARGAREWGETITCIQKGLRDEFDARLRNASWLHPLLLGRRSQSALALLAKARLLPLRPLYHLLH